MTNHDARSAEPVELMVAEEDSGTRLDVFLAQHFPATSRSSLRRIIDAAGAKVDGREVKASYRLRMLQRVCILPVESSVPEGPEPEDIPLKVLYEDDHFAAIDKPPGMVVHPAKGHWSGTLASALAFRFAKLSAAGGPTRPGIVHRIDRDTTGVIVVAKTDQAHAGLARQFTDRSIEKRYLAIVAGVPDRDRDTIRRPIGVHPHHREKMAIRPEHVTSRSAETFYEVQERFDGFALLSLRPRTGRTHQIRVHLTSIGHPVLCDRMYGGRAQITLAEIQRRHPKDQEDVLLARQALHAHAINLKHPISGTPLRIEAVCPTDMQAVLSALRRYRRS